MMVNRRMRAAETRWRRRNAIQVSWAAILLLTTGTLGCSTAGAFTARNTVMPPSASSFRGVVARRRTTLSVLWAAKKGKKPKKQGKSKRKANEMPTRQSYQPPAPTNKRKSSNTKSAPPWQVMSTKEAKKNVEKERARRANLKEGIGKGGEMQQHQLQENTSSNKTLSKAFLSEAEAKFLKWRRFNPTTVPAGQRFVGAYLGKKLPPCLGVPEIAFLGRSNVGKSSLLNCLSRSARGTTNDQARVGKTPGATASVNLYTLLDAKDREILGFVDLPGFGYAKLSKEVQESVQAAAENYLDKRKELALGILLVDIRRTPSDDDRALLAALYDMYIPVVVVATKMDKVSANERERMLLTIQDGLGLPDGQPLCISSVTGEGTRELWKIILEACETCVAEFKSKYVDDDDAAKLLLVDDMNEGEAELSAEFDESDDIAYSQGYDWIHADGSSVLYKDELMEDEDKDSLPFDDAHESDYIEPQRETLKSLRKKARELERGGEL